MKNNLQSKMLAVCWAFAATLFPTSAARAAEQLTVTFQTTQAGGVFAPRNVVAVWIETSQGAFVKTIGRWAARRAGDLSVWSSASGTDSDAVMGATRSNHASTLSVVWDLTNKGGQGVADATYKIRMDLADGSQANTTFTFDKNGVASTQSLSSTNFTQVSVVYTGRAVASTTGGTTSATSGTSGTTGGSTTTTGGSATGGSTTTTGGNTTGGSTTTGGATSATSGTSATTGDSSTTTGGSGAHVVVCGDGTLSAGEECDQNQLGNRTCADYGFAAGELRCSQLCQIDATGCTGASGPPAPSAVSCTTGSAGLWYLVVAVCFLRRIRQRA